MRILVLLILFGLISPVIAQDSAVWMMLHDPKQPGVGMFPVRLIFDNSGKVTLTALCLGVRREIATFQTKLVDGVFHYTDPKTSHEGTLKQDGETMVFSDGQTTWVFKNLPEWKTRFDAALPAPHTKQAAIKAMKTVFSTDIGKMKREELDMVSQLMQPIVFAFHIDDPKAPKHRPQGEEARELVLMFWENLQQPSSNK